MKHGVRDLTTGVVAIGAIIVFITLLFRFGELANVGTDFARLRLSVPSAKGLTQVAPVSLNGVKIGNITSIDMDPDRSGVALISIRFDDTIQIPTDFTVSMDSALIGESGLDFRVPVGRDAASLSFVVGEDEIYERDITALTDELASPLAKVEEAVDAFITLAATYDELGRSMESLASDARASMTQFDETNQVLRTELTRLGDVAESTTGELNGTLRTLDMTLGETQTTLAAINTGQGSLGMMIRDPELYNNLAAGAERLERSMFELELLMQKIRDEGIQLGF